MDRRRRHEDHANHEAWAIPYADLMTLLLAFFVVMYAISSVNEGKYRVISEALNSAFSGTQSNAGAMRMEYSQPSAGPSSPGGLPLTSNRAAPLIAMSKPKPKPDASEDPAEAERAAGRAQQLEKVAESIEKAMSGLIKEGLVVVRRKDDIVEVELRTDILFPSGSSQLTTQAHGVIERMGEALRPFPNELTVAGHTDDRPINTLEFPSNWELSSARAATVVHLLTERGVSPKRLTVVGHGEQDPVQPNDTEAGRNQNRRVVMTIRGTNEGALVGPLALAKPH
jgi:chemotaxis protein MotB